VFGFDKIFSTNASNERLFDKLQINYLCKRVVEGFNATVFCYGQTGSGKTYTMEGDPKLKNMKHYLSGAP